MTKSTAAHSKIMKSPNSPNRDDVLSQREYNNKTEAHKQYEVLSNREYNN